MNGLLPVLKIIVCIATIITGGIALFKPESIFTFIGLRADSGRGITELRSVMGSGLIALGAVPLFFPIYETFLMLGIAYLAVAVVRFISMFLDISISWSNMISFMTEVVFGIILVIR